MTYIGISEHTVGKFTVDCKPSKLYLQLTASSKDACMDNMLIALNRQQRSRVGLPANCHDPLWS